MQGRMDRGYFRYQKEYEEKALEVLRSGWYIPGKEVEKFEEEFASYVGTKYSVGDVPKKMNFSGTYNMSKEEVNQHVERVHAYISDFSESLKNYVSDTTAYLLRSLSSVV